MTTDESIFPADGWDNVYWLFCFKILTTFKLHFEKRLNWDTSKDSALKWTQLSIDWNQSTYNFPTTMVSLILEVEVFVKVKLDLE